MVAVALLLGSVGSVLGLTVSTFADLQAALQVDEAVMERRRKRAVRHLRGRRAPAEGAPGPLKEHPPDQREAQVEGAALVGERFDPRRGRAALGLEHD